MPTQPSLDHLYQQCVDLHAQSMYRVAYRLTGGQELAADLLQETYLQAWRSLDSLADHAKMKSWMFAILRHQFGKMLRRLPQHNAAPTATTEVADSATPLEAVDRDDLVQYALGCLDEEQKLPLLLVTMENWTVDEAAEALGWPRGTVLSRLHRGRLRLKSILAKQLDMDLGPPEKKTFAQISKPA